MIKQIKLKSSIIFVVSVYLLLSSSTNTLVKGGGIPGLKSCLSKITGSVVYSEDSGYSTLVKDENSAVTYKPTAIFNAANVNDVKIAVKCAASNKIQIVPRSGGHSYESYSLGGKDGALVVDLGKLNTISINTTSNQADVGTGNRLGQIYYALSQSGYIIPGGSCPSVGIGGHSLGGGYGLFSRKYGLAADNIVKINMIDATGSVITATAKNKYSDLFFALRGAGGGSYGIITSIVFNLSRPPSQVTSFQYRWSKDQATTVIPAITQFSKSGTNDITFTVYFDNNQMLAQGVYLGPKSKLADALSPLLKAAPGSTEVATSEGTAFDSVVFFSGTSVEGTKNPSRSPYNFKAKSFFVGQGGLSADGINALSNYLSSPGSGCVAYAMFDIMGGAVNTVAPDAMAYVHRDSAFGIQLLTTWSDSSLSNTCVGNINKFGPDFQKKYTSQYSYQNYIDRDLTNWQDAYYGSNFQKLVSIKAKYDPKDLFNFPQSIPTK